MTLYASQVNHLRHTVSYQSRTQPVIVQKLINSHRLRRDFREKLRQYGFCV